MKDAENKRALRSANSTVTFDSWLTNVSKTERKPEQKKNKDLRLRNCPRRVFELGADSESELKAFFPHPRKFSHYFSCFWLGIKASLASGTVWHVTKKTYHEHNGKEISFKKFTPLIAIGGPPS